MALAVAGALAAATVASSLIASRRTKKEAEANRKAKAQALARQAGFRVAEATQRKGQRVAGAFQGIVEGLRSSLIR